MDGYPLPEVPVPGVMDLAGATNTGGMKRALGTGGSSCLTRRLTLYRVAIMPPNIRLSHQGLRVLRAFLDALNEDVRAEMAGAELMRLARVSSGTLYPILLRFEKAGLLESRWEEETPQSLGRPRRRFYRMTQAGAQVAHEALAELSPSITDAAFKSA
jgi:PadR family transcriptional regulator, regulatory protein PadR